MATRCRAKRTVSVVVEVGELVAPLRDDAQGILEEGDDDEKAANCRNVAAPMLANHAACLPLTDRDSRLHGMRQSVEPVFDLARLFANGIQRARVVGGVCSSRATE